MDAAFAKPDPFLNPKALHAEMGQQTRLTLQYTN